MIKNKSAQKSRDVIKIKKLITFGFLCCMCGLSSLFFYILHCEFFQKNFSLYFLCKFLGISSSIYTYEYITNISFYCLQNTLCLQTLSTY